MTREEWAHWSEIARDEIEETLAGLPAPLQTRARTLPVALERIPGAGHIQDGIAADTLGLFVGPEYAEQEHAGSPVPPQIFLFLENLFEMTEGDEEFFREEVRTTYLHELGHYLGLDEDDLFERGLE